MKGGTMFHSKACRAAHWVCVAHDGALPCAAQLPGTLAPTAFLLRRCIVQRRRALTFDDPRSAPPCSRARPGGGPAGV